MKVIPGGFSKYSKSVEHKQKRARGLRNAAPLFLLITFLSLLRVTEANNVISPTLLLSLRLAISLSSIDLKGRQKK